MEAELRIETTLEHDGDGLAHFAVSATNGEFSASIGTWDQTSAHLGLASVLRDFPVGSNTQLNYRLGATGTCELAVSSLDTLGHIGVWLIFTADWPVAPSDRHQTASLFMRCDPASIDTFVSELSRFAPGSSNRARLLGLGP